ncbi:MAG: hypothetical protein OXK76_12775 [Gammaproteobacteria bacterium]|nr:hypothetical protein [Gammaproteobacteria bacterium]
MTRRQRSWLTCHPQTGRAWGFACALAIGCLASTAQEDETFVADTARNWDSVRSGVWAVEYLIRAEVAGVPPPQRGTWGMTWIRRFLAMAANRENPGRLIGYTVGRRRMEGLPDIDLRTDFVSGVEARLVEEAAGPPLHWEDWNEYWVSELRRLSQGAGKLIPLQLVGWAADVAKPLDLACYLVQRRREEGFQELKGVTIPCSATAANPLGHASLHTGRAGTEATQDRDHSRREMFEWVNAEETFADLAVRALAVAAVRGDTKEIDRLIAAGVDPNARGVGNVTPLHWAWHKLATSELLTESISRTYWIVMRGREFRMAAQGRAVDFLAMQPMVLDPITAVPPGVARLLERGADPNIRCANGTGLLHEAVALRWPALVRAALRRGADPNLPDDQGEPPLAWILAAGHPTDEDLRLVKMLLDAPGFEIEAPNGYGTTLAMRVAGVRDDILLEFLKRGADYRARNGAGYSVLDRLSFAEPYHFPRRLAARQHKRVVRWLRRQGVTLPLPTTTPSASGI